MEETTMKKSMALILVLSVLAVGCLNDIEEASLELAGTEIAAPAGLTARVSDGTVHLEWRSVSGASSYRLYRATGQPLDPTRIAETADTSYTDSNLVNGRVYYYSVAAVTAGPLEGSPSDQITAVPSVYSILINGGTEVTSSRSVTLEITGPSTTALMKIGHDPDLTGAVWETFYSARSWLLEEEDGLKTVYALFQDAGGTISPVTSAAITLDTYAEITGLEISESSPFTPGSILHFVMNVGNDERGGEALVRIEGFSLQIPLFDNGNGGDPTRGDGVYETSYRMPLYVRGHDLTVTGDFLDAAGNRATSFEMEELISFTDPPDPVYLFGAVDSTTSSITIRWEPSEEEHITAYRIYRDTSSGVDETVDRLVTTISNVTQSTYTDQGLTEGETYYYRLFVVNDVDETAGSNERAASTFDTYPDPVVLDSLTAIGDNRLTLTWSRNNNSDFEEYRVYRATAPGVTESSLLVATIDEREITFLDDTGLDTQANLYYYRVYVVDRGGKASRSNEMSTE
jgi:fibronectin type 3 domain-containing protein